MRSDRRDKSFEQIPDLPNSYILADGIEHPIGKKLPLWLVGICIELNQLEHQIFFGVQTLILKKRRIGYIRRNGVDKHVGYISRINPDKMVYFRKA